MGDVQSKEKIGRGHNPFKQKPHCEKATPGKNPRVHLQLQKTVSNIN